MDTDLKRDYYLDTVKGLLIISVIFIHTVFHSGSYYVPKYMQNIALIFDVPVFFFITGCIMSKHIKLDPLKQMYKLMLIFFFGVLVSQISFMHFYGTKLVSSLFLMSSQIPKLPSIQASYWFVPVYIVTLLFAKIIIYYFRNWVKYIFLVTIPIYYIVQWFRDTSSTISVLGINLQFFLFYLWLLLLGYELFKTKGKKWWIVLSIIFIIIIGIFFYNLSSLSFQTCKFPPKLPYIVLSLIPISILMFFYRVVKNNVIAQIGKNSLYYYLSQGVGASLIYPLAQLHINSWELHFLICYCVNLLISLSVGYVLVLVYPRFEKLVIK